MSVETVEIDTVQARLIQEIMAESEVRREQDEAQSNRLSIAEKLKAATLRANQQMTECAAIDLACKGRLHSSEKAKAELLRTTPEGRQIRSLQAEIAELRWVKGEPQLPQLYRKLEAAEDRNLPDEIEAIKSKIASLQTKIDQKQREIDRLWCGFGFDADALPKSSDESSGNTL